MPTAEAAIIGTQPAAAGKHPPSRNKFGSLTKYSFAAPIIDGTNARQDECRAVALHCNAK
jgi:hypothetical protein